MPSVELNTEYQEAKRFPAWVSLAVFSVVCMAGITSRRKEEEEKFARQGDQKWALAVASISCVFGIISVICYLTCRSLYMGQVFEVVLIAVTLGFWGVGLPVIMNPKNDIAVYELTVVNANLYFASWVCFVITVLMAFHLLQEISGINVRSLTPEKAPRWYGLTASSLVVMGSAIRIFKSVGCNTPDHYINRSHFCKRTKFAMALGVLSFFFSGVMTIMVQTGILDVFTEVLLTTFLFVMWCFGVGYITFGSSPGSEIGNLYFSTWISFVLIVLLFGNAMKELFGGGPAPAQNSDQPTEGVEANGGTHEDYGESHGASSYDQSPQRHTTPVIPSEDDM